MDNRGKSERRRRRESEAMDWFVRMQAGELSPDALAEWGQWIASSDNESAFASVERLWKNTDAAGGMSLPTAAEIRRDEYDGSISVAEWISRSRPWSSSAWDQARRPRAWLAVAAAAVLGVGAITLVQWASGPTQQSVAYQTTDGQNREIQLNDGSRVTLGAASRMSVEYSRARRTVVLDRGEALFHVAPNHERPFVVVAGSGTITAVGTIFNVKRDPGRVVVTVAEGKIKVAPRAVKEQHTAPDVSGPRYATTLDVGEQITYDAHGNLNAITHSDPDAVTAWRDGRLRYRAERLKFVISDVNRYSRRDVVMADPEIGDLVFTGTVFEGELDDWVRSLEDVFPVQVRERPDGTIVLSSRN